MNKYEVYSTISLPVSIEVNANSKEHAMMIAQYKMNEMIVKEIKVQITTLNNQKVKPTVHDWNIDIDCTHEEDVTA
ncbi:MULTISPECIES: hypothetical protein [Bacillaceae]|uniref:Uncharacterized protein n=1 Tax=Evansella alkalicola TaxID=745819 RepID=A0ABS6JS53_9BACI|nr:MULTISPECIES: hypothetical protein [Bacillaceae]MBU9720539.1 hypothetical protein [Bacillus alkalicola]